MPRRNSDSIAIRIGAWPSDGLQLYAGDFDTAGSGPLFASVESLIDERSTYLEGKVFCAETQI